MEKEKYIVLQPNGAIHWMETERENRRKRFKEIIDCELLERVRTIIPHVSMLVDESGKVKDFPQQDNKLASLFYAGYHSHGVMIAGPVIFVREDFGDDNELEWFPLLDFQQKQLLGDMVPLTFERLS